MLPICIGVYINVPSIEEGTAITVSDNTLVGFKCNTRQVVSMTGAIMIGKDSATPMKAGASVLIEKNTINVNCAEINCRAHNIFIGGLQADHSTSVTIRENTLGGGTTVRNGHAYIRRIEMRRFIFTRRDTATVPANSPPGALEIVGNVMTTTDELDSAIYHAPESQDASTPGASYTVPPSEGGIVTVRDNIVSMFSTPILLQFASDRFDTFAPTVPFEINIESNNVYGPNLISAFSIQSIRIHVPNSRLRIRSLR